MTTNMKGQEMSQNEERMDAMTPNGVGTAEIPVALSLLATTIAAQVDLGIGIQRAHEEEVRRHRETKWRLQHAELDAKRFKEDHQNACKTIAEMHAAVFGGEVRGPERGVVEDVTELWVKAHNLELELLEAKALIESATAQNANWEKTRREWQARVSQTLGLPTNPDSDEDPVFGIEPEEPHGESHS